MAGRPMVAAIRLGKADVLTSFIKSRVVIAEAANSASTWRGQGSMRLGSDPPNPA
jgi:hypothetical protein